MSIWTRILQSTISEVSLPGLHHWIFSATRYCSYVFLKKCAHINFKKCTKFHSLVPCCKQLLVIIKKCWISTLGADMEIKVFLMVILSLMCHIRLIQSEVSKCKVIFSYLVYSTCTDLYYNLTMLHVNTQFANNMKLYKMLC